MPAHAINAISITLYWTLIYIGIILINEAITRRLNHTSLLRTLRRSKVNLFWFVVASTIGGIILDGFGHWLGHLWIDPYFSSIAYLFIFIPGFAAYFLMIAESYLGIKAIVDRLIKPHKTARRYFKFEPQFYRRLGLVGVILLGISVATVVERWRNEGNALFTLNATAGARTPFIIFVLFFLGVWFVSEYIEYHRRETSLLKDIFHHYWNPVIAILLATVAGQIQELINRTHNYWQYVNWPLASHQVAGLPVAMIVIGWPLHFVMFLSLFRAITAKDSKDVWRAP